MDLVWRIQRHFPENKNYLQADFSLVHFDLKKRSLYLPTLAIMGSEQ